MIIRGYIPPAVPLDKLSDKNRKSRLVFERKKVDRLIFEGPTKLLTIYTKGKIETVDHNDCCIEIVEGEINDNVINEFSCND